MLSFGPCPIKVAQFSAAGPLITEFSVEMVARFAAVNMELVPKAPIFGGEQ